MTKNVRLTLLGISLGVAFLAGCELIVDFDRTRIPADAADGAAPPRDATTDTAAPDSSVDASDGGSDASDATTGDASDGATDADLDAAIDAADAE